MSEQIEYEIEGEKFKLTELHSLRKMFASDGWLVFARIMKGISAIEVARTIGNDKQRDVVLFHIAQGTMAALQNIAAIPDCVDDGIAELTPLEEK